MINTLLDRKGLFFCCLWLLTGLLYAPGWEAGFYADFHYALQQYQSVNFCDFLNRAGTQNHSLYQGTQLLLYLLITLFKAHPLPWFLLATALHALVTAITYFFFRSYATVLGMDMNGLTKKLLAVAALIFLLAPIQVVTVTWKACFHYFTALLLIFSILRLGLAYIRQPKTAYLIYSWLLYALSATMLELFYLTPALLLALCLSLCLAGKMSRNAGIKVYVRMGLPMLLIWILYLLIYHHIYGKWIAHYNFDLTHSFSLMQAFGKLGKDYLHLLFFESALPEAWRGKVLDLMNRPVIVFTFGAGMLSLLFIGIWRFRKMTAYDQFLYSLWVMALLSQLLIIPMWFNDESIMANDQHYYLSGLFLYYSAVLLVYRLIPQRIIRLCIGSLYLLLCIYTSRGFITIQRNAAHIHKHLLQELRIQDADTVVFLSLPFSYKGIWILPAEQPDVVGAHLRVFGYDTLNGVAYDVSSYQMNQLTDSTIAIVRDSLTVDIRPGQYGTWWSGSHDYENELYHFFTTDDHAFNARIRFKHPLSDRTILLLHKGTGWKRLDMQRYDTAQ